MNSDGWLRGPQWATPTAKAEWSDRLEAAAAAWEELEIMSVTSGLRESALVFLTPNELVRATADAARMGRHVVPLSWVSGSMRAAICPPHLTGPWLTAWRAGDNARIGDLLGFPKCCAEFFHQTWVEQGLRDTTPAMGGVSAGAGGPTGANILLRRLGVRLVPHLPCSFECERSGEWAGGFVHAARCAGIEDVDEILRFLALPASWSACNGAAVVDVAGILRFSYETDARPAPIAFRRGGFVPTLEPPPWRDNGFSSRASMSAAHELVASVVGHVESAIDLGSGDGSLLSRISGGRGGNWLAIESDPGRAARGARRRPRLQFTTSRIEAPELSVPAEADVALIMPGRLLEMDAQGAERVRELIPGWARRLVVYAYGDTLAEGGLEQLFRWSKLPGSLGSIIAGQDAQAAEVIW